MSEDERRDAYWERIRTMGPGETVEVKNESGRVLLRVYAPGDDAEPAPSSNPRTETERVRFLPEGERAMEETAEVIREKTLKAVCTWLRIMEENGKFPTSALEVDIAMEHSALLPFLLSGFDPLPEPPPLCNSRPHHHLVVSGYGYPQSVHGPYDFGEDGNLTLTIDGCEWDLVEQLSDHSFVVTPSERYGPTGSRWRVTAQMPDGSAWGKDWKIERIDWSPTTKTEGDQS